jgi:hypothetical protein
VVVHSANTDPAYSSAFTNHGVVVQIYNDEILVKFLCAIFVLTPQVHALWVNVVLSERDSLGRSSEPTKKVTASDLNNATVISSVVQKLWLPSNIVEKIEVKVFKRINKYFIDTIDCRTLMVLIRSFKHLI